MTMTNAVLRGCGLAGEGGGEGRDGPEDGGVVDKLFEPATPEVERTRNVVDLGVVTEPQLAGDCGARGVRR
mgnify:CR=1 FL=1